MKIRLILLALGFGVVCAAVETPTASPLLERIDTVTKQFEEMRAQNATLQKQNNDLQIANQYFQILADRNALGLQVAGLQKQVADLTAERDAAKNSLEAEKAKVEALLREAGTDKTIKVTKTVPEAPKK